MDYPTVSVVICTYNQDRFVEETVNSVFGQSYPHIEIIVTDDGSTDETPAVLQRFVEKSPDRIKTVLHPQNTGIPANINRGLAIRTAKYTAWLDGDDVMLPGKIEKQVQLLENHPEAVGCYHDSEIFDSESNLPLGRMSLLYNGTPKLKAGLLQDWLQPRYYFVPSAIMARTDACPRHGFDERLRYLSEVLYFVEVFRNGPLLAIDEPLVRYRRHTGNITGDPKAREASHEYEMLAYAIIQARYPELHALVHKLRISSMLTETIRWHREGNSMRFRAMVRNCVREGAWMKSSLVFLGVVLAGRRVKDLTSGQPYSRPGWIKRLAAYILRF